MPDFHRFNKELFTPNLTPLCFWFKFPITDASGAVGTISQAKANMVSSITRNSAGNYTVQLTKPYPYEILNIRATVNRNAVGDPMRNMTYDVGTFSSTTGQFVLLTSRDTAVNDTTQIAADPGNGSEVHVEVVFVGRKQNV